MKLKKFSHFRNIDYYIVLLVIQTIFTLQIFCFWKLFFLYCNNFENIGKCDFMWYKLKLLEAHLNFTSFPTQKKAHVVGRWTRTMNTKTFWYSSPYSLPPMKVRRRTFDSFHHIYLRRQRWGMELIDAVGTKLNSIHEFLKLAS